jgi:signal transduction histidine kinase
MAAARRRRKSPRAATPFRRACTATAAARKAVLASPSAVEDLLPASQVLADRLRVCDDGVGIAPDELPTIHQRGVRGRNCGGDGSGLGLALVQHLCNRFGWRLEVDSVLDGGTRMEWIFHPGPASGRRVGVP